jgi:hypothetical protein
MLFQEKPHSCHALGLECRDCVAGSALQLALVCGHIPTPDVERIFFKMYDDPSCHHMQSNFCDVYRASVRGGAFTSTSSSGGDVTSPEPDSTDWSYTGEPVLAS